jgi:hypothetical protein
MEGILFPRGLVEGRESLEAYRSRGGYEALVKAIKQLSPNQVMQEVAESGLRGRGGAGFPTGKKWSFTAEAPETPHYVVLNGGEDEPGSKKDRLLMENLPLTPSKRQEPIFTSTPTTKRPFRACWMPWPKLNRLATAESEFLAVILIWKSF